jgi:hypothetical protein
MEMQRQTNKKASFPVETLSGADKSFPRANSNFSNALLEDADYA